MKTAVEGRARSGRGPWAIVAGRPRPDRRGQRDRSGRRDDRPGVRRPRAETIHQADPSQRTRNDPARRGSGTSAMVKMGERRTKTSATSSRGRSHPDDFDTWLKESDYAEVAEAVTEKAAAGKYFSDVIKALDHRGWIDGSFSASWRPNWRREATADRGPGGVVGHRAIALFGRGRGIRGGPRRSRCWRRPTASARGAGQRPG